jgi:hypothetical protein
MAQAIPEFGGIYRADSAVNVFLTDTTAASRVRLVISQPGFYPNYFSRKIRVVPAQFTYKNLIAWMSCVQSLTNYEGAFALPDRENKVVVHAGSPEAVKRVEKAISSLGLPRDAFRVDRRRIIIRT